MELFVSNKKRVLCEKSVWYLNDQPQLLNIDIAQTFSLIMQASAVAKNVSDMLI